LINIEFSFKSEACNIYRSQHELAESIFRIMAPWQHSCLCGCWSSGELFTTRR